MSESIENLRTRWEQDPSPQLSMQLAEEYRRQNQREEAAEVLSRALEKNPDHVAARVALGRFRSELGQVDEACSLLERVVSEDPTHLVANKLLVGLYIARGEKKGARDRLDLYKLLNSSDPEIEQLEAALLGGIRAPIAVPMGVADVPRNGDPFQDLWSDLDMGTYWEAFGAEGIFPVIGRAPVVRRGVSPEESADLEAPETTVTLANLYLQQGHLEDAETAFREVLQGQPTSTEALAGLQEIERQRREALAAEAPVASEEAADSGDETTSRKIENLRGYLRRIRGGADQE